MNVLTDWSFLWPYVIKSLIVCFGVLGGGGYLLCRFLGYHEPEDDM